MSEKITASITVSDETITAELNTAARGATGISSISASTSTAFSGFLAGDGANVQLATTAQKIALPISTATQTALDAKETSGAAATVQGNLDTHEADTANPHTVTKAQVGLGNAENTSDASKPVSTAQAAADAVVLAAAVQRANHTGTQTLATISDAGTAAASATGDFTPIAHATDTANPHTVTKAQVGLGNVDNTSDANAPVSTAQQTALDLKISATTANTTTAIEAMNTTQAAASREGLEVNYPIAYENGPQAIASGVVEGDLFRDFNGGLRRAWREVFRIALAGDSLFNASTAAGTVSSPRSVMTGLVSYGEGRFVVVEPAGRDSFIHAVGGCDTAEFATGQAWAGTTVYQQTELIAQAADIDCVVVQIGANDIQSATYNIDTSFAQIEANIVAPLLGAGLMVCLEPMIPGDDKAISSGGTYDDALVAWNERLIATYGNRASVMVLDLSAYYADAGALGINNGAWGLKDGTHQSQEGSMHNGSRIAMALRSLLPDSHENIWSQGEPITENPWNTAAGTRQLQSFSSGGGPTLTLANNDRFDGEVGERWAEITIGLAAQEIGTTANQKVAYTVTGGGMYLIEHYAETGHSNPTLSVDITTDPAGYKRVRVNLEANNLVVISTATEVAAIVNGVPELSGIVTAVAGGTGADAVKYGRVGSGEVRTPLSVADALLVSDGDELRAICVIRPSRNGILNLLTSHCQLRADTTTISTGMASSFAPERLLPHPIGDEIVIMTPWHTVVGGQSKFAIRAYFTGFGTCRIGRMMVQRKT